MAPPKVAMKKWHEFAKEYQKENNLESYTDALKQAPESWRKYKERFSAENPSYDHKAVLAYEKQERDLKIAQGILPPPKSRKKKGVSGGGASGGGVSGEERKKKKEGKERMVDSNKKEMMEVDSDDEYDVVVRTVTTKKRKRTSGEKGKGKGKEEKNELYEGIPPKPKNKRKRTQPVKKVPTTNESPEEHPPLTVKTPGKPIPLPASSIKRSSTKGVGVGVGKGGAKKQPPPVSLAQEPEEDFLQEIEEGEEGEDEGLSCGMNRSCYVEDSFH